MTAVTRLRRASLLSEASKELEDVFHHFFSANEAATGETRSRAWSPRVDVSETDLAFIVKADVPGVDPKEIDVTSHEGGITFQGDNKEPRGPADRICHPAEQFIGPFFRTVPLPGCADADGITTMASNGTITVPKKPVAAPKHVVIAAVP